MRFKPSTAIAAIALLGALPLAASTGCNLESRNDSAAQNNADTATGASFHFQLQTDEIIDLTVMSGDAPVPGAQVTIRAAGSAAPTGETADGDPAPDTLFQGMSGADGHVTGKWSRRVDMSNVDVITTMPGYRGPYTFEETRAGFGLFAPTAWQRVPATSLNNVSIALTKVGGS